VQPVNRREKKVEISPLLTCFEQAQLFHVLDNHLKIGIEFFNREYFDASVNGRVVIMQMNLWPFRRFVGIIDPREPCRHQPCHPGNVDAPLITPARAFL
jgi:hypothetical protein